MLQAARRRLLEWLAPKRIVAYCAAHLMAASGSRSDEEGSGKSQAA
jgi:hypothetical protein